MYSHILNQPVPHGLCLPASTNPSSDPHAVYVYIVNLSAAEHTLLEVDLFCCCFQSVMKQALFLRYNQTYFPLVPVFQSYFPLGACFICDFINVGCEEIHSISCFVDLSCLQLGSLKD